MSDLKNFIQSLPKAELHIHIEGSFEPELMFKIAKRNNIKIPFNSIEEVRQAYKFNNLQEFLDIYYQGTGVLINEQDFYDMTWAYLEKAHQNNIVHCEIFFDPQTHTDRGITFKTVITGIHRALQDAQDKFQISSKIIMCFLRHLDEESAFKTLEEALPFKDLITAVGLDSGEQGNPPSKFERVYAKALEEGFLTVAHAGEEGPAEYVTQALDLLKVSRIDHGNHALDDQQVTQRLIKEQIPLTVCPLSNQKLQVVPDLTKHPLKTMLDQNLLVTINSDDPAYFGGYLNDNYLAISEALNLNQADLMQLAKNSFTASFLNEKDKQKWIDTLNKI